LRLFCLLRPSLPVLISCGQDSAWRSVSSTAMSPQNQSLACQITEFDRRRREDTMQDISLQDVTSAQLRTTDLHLLPPALHQRCRFTEPGLRIGLPLRPDIPPLLPERMGLEALHPPRCPPRPARFAHAPFRRRTAPRPSPPAFRTSRSSSLTNPQPLPSPPDSPSASYNSRAPRWFLGPCLAQILTQQI
jgi:hypothetical protein